MATDEPLDGSEVKPYRKAADSDETKRQPLDNDTGETTMKTSFGPKTIGYLLTYPGRHPHVRSALPDLGSEVVGSLRMTPATTTHTSEVLVGGAA